MPAKKQSKPKASVEDRLDALTLRMQAIENRMDRAGSSALYLEDDQALLRDARKAVGWTMRDVASGLGVSANLVLWWEQGRMRIPMWRARTIVAMFSAHNVKPPAWPSVTSNSDD